MEHTPKLSLEPRSLEGQSLGRYEIISKLGEGGMAIVYKAIHRDFQSPVAIKLLLPDFQSHPLIARRFHEEARLLFKLRHPNLIRVLELIDESKLLGMVMDYIPGKNLATLLEERRQPFSFDAILSLFLPILRAVAYAHQKGIIHRDLKPSNILVEDAKEKLIPYVLDLGIAKVLDGTHVTQAGMILGTPYYCPPEQIQGQRALDHRADIYALGCTLYELLTLQPPFLQKSSIHELLLSHLIEPIPSLQPFYPSLASRLDPFFQKLLAKSPDDRFPSCEIFASELHSLFSSLSASSSISLSASTPSAPPLAPAPPPLEATASPTDAASAPLSPVQPPLEATASPMKAASAPLSSSSPPLEATASPEVLASPPPALDGSATIVESVSPFFSSDQAPTFLLEPTQNPFAQASRPSKPGEGSRRSDPHAELAQTSRLSKPPASTYLFPRTSSPPSALSAPSSVPQNPPPLPSSQPPSSKTSFFFWLALAVFFCGLLTLLWLLSLLRSS